MIRVFIKIFIKNITEYFLDLINKTEWIKE